MDFYLSNNKEAFIMKCLINTRHVFVIALVVSIFIGYAARVNADVSSSKPTKTGQAKAAI